MFNSLKALFSLTPLTDMMCRELAVAERQKLEAEDAVDYATAMVEYNTRRIERLSARLDERRLKGLKT